MGRSRLPKELLDLSGQTDFRPQRLKDRAGSSLVAFPKDTQLIEPSVKLSAKTRKSWDITIPCLLRMGILAPCDILLLEKGFESLEEANKALEELKKFDKRTKDIPIEDKLKTRQKFRNWYRESLADSITIFSKFGLTPSARAALTLNPTEDKKEEDPLDILLDG